MKKKVLVFGASGMLGHVVVRYFKETGRYDLLPCSRKVISGEEGVVVDVTDFNKVSSIIKEHRPDFVINAVGMLVKASSENPALAILVNSYFPHFLANLGKQSGFKLIHISTDCVFSGKTGKYSENSFRDGDLVYDRTKAMGEVVDSRNLTIRTSIIGPELNSNGSGLFSWFMRQSGIVNGYANAIWSGVTTLELAKAIDAAITQDIVGLYQLTMPPISKYDLLLLIKKVWHKSDVEVIPYSDFHCDKSLVCTRVDFQYELPKSHEIMLKELYDWYGN